MSDLKVPVTTSDHMQGPADAPVTLVEYGDYECPYCGEFNEVMKAVQARMGGQLCYVFRQFPLVQIHPYAEHAAEIAEAAGAAHKFWPMHEALYANQRNLEDADLVEYAKQVGLGREAAEAALGGQYLDRIRRDVEGGERSGVQGTPWVFIAGRQYDGPRDADSVYAAIEAANSQG